MHMMTSTTMIDLGNRNYTPNPQEHRETIVILHDTKKREGPKSPHTYSDSFSKDCNFSLARSTTVSKRTE